MDLLAQNVRPLSSVTFLSGPIPIMKNPHELSTDAEKTLLFDEERPWQKHSSSFIGHDTLKDDSHLLVSKDDLISMLREELRTARNAQAGGSPYPFQLKNPSSGSYYSQNIRKMKQELSMQQRQLDDFR